MAQSVGRSIALLFHDRGTRRGWVVSSTPRPHFTPGKDPVPILQEAGWASGPVWMGGKCRPHRNSIPDRPACSQSLYRLSYPADLCFKVLRELMKYVSFKNYWWVPKRQVIEQKRSRTTKITNKSVKAYYVYLSGAVTSHVILSIELFTQWVLKSTLNSSGMVKVKFTVPTPRAHIGE